MFLLQSNRRPTIYSSLAEIWLSFIANALIDSSALAFLKIQTFMLFGFIGISGTGSLELARHSSLQQTICIIYRHKYKQLYY
ncbi:hypothetical protein F4703DRAFT_1824778 [Phycomyces blakesleeanus]